MLVALTKTWIDRRLSRKDREKLIDYLLERTSSPTGEQILDALVELFPGREDLPSVRSCNEWKAKTWKLVIQSRQLREDSDAARIISESNGKLADANANLADAYVFGELRKLREGGDVDPDLREWILAASRLAARVQGDKRLESDLAKSRAQAEKLEAEVAEYRRKDAEREAAKKAAQERISKKGGISPEAMEEIDELLKLI